MKLMNERKQIAFRVPFEKAEQYEKQANREGHGTLSGWIVSILNDHLLEANKLLAESQQSERTES
jgi:hypothetical protein